MSNFASHSYDYRPNWTPLGPINIMNKVLLKNVPLKKVPLGSALLLC